VSGVIPKEALKTLGEDIVELQLGPKSKRVANYHYSECTLRLCLGIGEITSTDYAIGIKI
jgi:hypothetical protein